MTLYVRRAAPLLVLAVWAAALAGCASERPAQDRRIYAASPVAKMSADVLWKDYAADAGAADRKYREQVIEISGAPTVVPAAGADAAYVMFAQKDTIGVRANLLDDDAGKILKAAAESKRITLKCYCAGLSGNVVLKSCVLRE